MSLNDYKHTTQYICSLKGWDRVPVQSVWLLFTEEVGELASAIRQFNKMFTKTNLTKDKGIDVQMEMGDVFSYLFQLAYMLNVDLDEMWNKHQVKILNRSY